MVTPVSRCGQGSGEGTQEGSGQSQCLRQAVGFGAPPCTWASRAALGMWAAWLSPSGILALLSSPKEILFDRQAHPSEENDQSSFPLSSLSKRRLHRGLQAGSGRARRPKAPSPRTQVQETACSSPVATCLILLDPEAPFTSLSVRWPSRTLVTCQG